MAAPSVVQLFSEQEVLGGRNKLQQFDDIIHRKQSSILEGAIVLKSSSNDIQRLVNWGVGAQSEYILGIKNFPFLDDNFSQAFRKML